MNQWSADVSGKCDHCDVFSKGKGNTKRAERTEDEAVAEPDANLIFLIRKNYYIFG